MIMKSSSQLILYTSEKLVMPIYGRIQNTIYPPRHRLTKLSFVLLAPWGLSKWDS